MRPRVARVMTAAASAGALLLASSAALFVWPPEDDPRRADAIVVFAGGGERMALARDLAGSGLAPVTVVSNPGAAHTVDEGYAECREGGFPYPTPVECFVPDPRTTRGEARHIAALAEARGWSSLLLVVSDDQVVRAKLLLERCFDGDVQVSGTSPSASPATRAAYEWAALGRALLLRRGC